MADNKINVGGRLHSIATGNVLAGADEIVDDNKEGKKQSVINAETDTALEDRYTKAETYNKTQLDNMITTPEIAYKDYDTYADMIAETNHPAGAIYRVANYDGTQAVTNKYAEYSWDGTQYKLMAVRDHGIDDEPTNGSDNLVKSGGVHSSETDILQKIGYIVKEQSFYLGEVVFDNQIAQAGDVIDFDITATNGNTRLQFYDQNDSALTSPPIFSGNFAGSYTLPTGFYVAKALYGSGFHAKYINLNRLTNKKLADEVDDIKENLSDINFEVENNSNYQLFLKNELFSFAYGYYNIPYNKIDTDTTVYKYCKIALRSGDIIQFTARDIETSTFKSLYFIPSNGDQVVSLTGLQLNAVFTAPSDGLVYISTSISNISYYAAFIPGSIVSSIKNWILSESFTVNSVTRDSDGNVSSASVVFPDNVSGTLTITRDSDGNVTSVVSVYRGITFTLTISRDSDGNVTSTNIVKL